jgi:hypothetical protein
MKLCLALLVTGLLFSASVAHGLPTTVHFSGTISSVDDPEALAGTGIEVGSPFSGSYTSVDTGGPRVNAPPEVMILPTPGTFHLEIGSFVYDATFIYVIVGSEGLGLPDGTVVWEPLSYHAFADERVGLEAGIGFLDEPPVEATPAAALLPRSLAGWDRALIGIFGADPPYSLATGTVTHVPEPSCIALLVLLAAAVGTRSRW